jgi:hypothetical protein
MRDRFPVMLVSGVILSGVLGWFLMLGARRGAFADHLSTFKSERDGARALYLLLSEAQVAVTRLQRDFKTIPNDQNFVLLGSRFADAASATSTFDQPDAGPDDDDDDDDRAKEKTAPRDLNSVRAPRISTEDRERLLEHVKSGATLVVVPSSIHDLEWLEGLGVTLERADDDRAPLTLVPAQPSAYVRGVERVEAKVLAFLELPEGAVPLLVDDRSERVVAGLVHHGLGRLIVIGAPHLATNENLAVADNARFWLSLISTIAKSGPVGFDEFHHGFTQERSLGEFAARYGLHFAVGQALLGVVLWALSLRRFGRSQGPVEQLRVGTTDALQATSRLYREGGHHAYATATIVNQLSAECAARAGASARLTPTQVGAALDQRGRAELSRALLEMAAVARATTTEYDVQKVATLAAAARKLLNHHPQE